MVHIGISRLRAKPMQFAPHNSNRYYVMLDHFGIKLLRWIFIQSPNPVSILSPCIRVKVAPSTRTCRPSRNGLILPQYNTYGICHFMLHYLRPFDIQVTTNISRNFRSCTVTLSTCHCKTDPCANSLQSVEGIALLEEITKESCPQIPRWLLISIHCILHCAMCIVV